MWVTGSKPAVGKLERSILTEEKNNKTDQSAPICGDERVHWMDIDRGKGTPGGSDANSSKRGEEKSKDCVTFNYSAGIIELDAAVYTSKQNPRNVRHGEQEDRH